VASLKLPASVQVSAMALEGMEIAKGPLTFWIQHSLDGAACAGSLSKNNELEAVAGDKCHIFGEAWGCLTKGRHAVMFR